MSTSGKIFISYRRDDSSGSTGRIYDRLLLHFEQEQVFMDVDLIPPGVDFVDVITNAVEESDVMIVVIGKKWLHASDKHGQSLLSNPMDFVRMEISTALNHNIRVVPVLVDNAVMPRPDELPDDVKALARRNAVELTHIRFNADTDRLIAAIKTIVETCVEQKREKALVEELRRQEEDRRREEELKRKQEEERIAGEKLKMEEKNLRIEARRKLREQRLKAPKKKFEWRGLISSMYKKENFHTTLLIWIPVISIITGFVFSAMLAAFFEAAYNNYIALDSKLGGRLFWGSTIGIFILLLVVFFIKRNRNENNHS